MTPSPTPSEGEAMLKPCPFCGRKAALCILEDSPGELISAWVNCTCGIETRERRTEREAIELWNTRAAAQSSGVREWQPIETAPREGQFLALMHDGREPPNPFHEIIEWNDHGFGKGTWMNDGGSEYDEDAEAKGYARPLLWMPLPASPDTPREGER